VVRRRLFTNEDVTLMTAMARAGADGNMIAQRLGVDPLRVRHKLSALGVPLRRRERPANDVMFMMDERAFAKLREAAKVRGTSSGRLARLLVELCVRDELIEDLLDQAVALRAFILTERATPTARQQPGA
jgi:hypothetical protein